MADERASGGEQRGRGEAASGESEPSGGPETLLAGETLPAGEQGLEGPRGYGADPTHIGRFVILRRVGEGGMGVVYAAYDNELERRVAIKLVRHARADADSGARVRREAQAMARLSHPNVVQVYEVGAHEEQVYVAMEFVTGPTLKQWADELPASPARWRAVLAKYLDAGRGLAAAHAARIVHRDFKPANAILGEDGRVRVLDFGIARALELAPASADETPIRHPDDMRETTGGSPALTRTGALVGTPAYMSPEQFERRDLDARSDQFSFCVALYEALYGARPFAGDNPAALVRAVIAGELRPPPTRVEVPGWVREVLVRGLAREPAQRWPSMEALLAALDNDPAERRRQRARVAVALSMGALVLAAGAWFARVKTRDLDEAEARRAEAQRAEARASAREAEAEAARDRALREARANARRARDTARVLAARGLSTKPDVAVALLRDVEQPAATPGWRSAAVNALQRPVSEAVLRGHEDRVTYLDVSRDGRWLASASFDGSARLWPRAGPGSRGSIALPHDDAVYGAAFSRQGDRLVTASRDHSVRVWQLPARDPNPDADPDPALPEALPAPTILRGHSDLVWSAQFSPDGARVVSASRDGSARVWPLDAPGEPQIHATDEHTILWWAEFSPDGRWIVAAGSDGLARVWSVDEPERPAIELVGHEDSVGDVHFAPSMNVIATASLDGSARLFRFDPEDPGPVRAHAVLDHEGAVYRARFSDEGLRLITAAHDGSAKVWTLDELGAPAPDPRVFDTEAGVVWSADFSPDGHSVALGLGSGEVQIWPLRGGPKLSLTGHSSDVFRVRFSPEGRRLYSGSSDGSLRVWDTHWGAAARPLDAHQKRVSALEQRGRVLASGSDDGSVRVWSVQDPGPGLAVSEAPAVLGGHRGAVHLALDGFPRLLASADDEQGQVRLWRITGTWVLEPERPLARLDTGGVAVRSLSLDDAGEQLAAALLDGSVLLWRLEGLDAGAPQARRLGAHDISSTAGTLVQLSPDGRWLASGGADRLVKLWDLGSGSAAAPPRAIELAGHRRRINSLAFSPDGRRLVSTSLDHSARVWSLDQPEAEPVVLDHRYWVNAAAFDSSGQRLATACSDTRVYLWRLEAPGQPTLLEGAAGEVRDVAFSPDDRWVAAAAYDGRVRLWPVEGGEAIEFDAGFPLARLSFADGGRRLAAAGNAAEIPLWYLGPQLDPATLVERLARATSLCLSPGQRVQFIGESTASASAASETCRR